MPTNKVRDRPAVRTDLHHAQCAYANMGATDIRGRRTKMGGFLLYSGTKNEDRSGFFDLPAPKVEDAGGCSIFGARGSKISIFDLTHACVYACLYKSCTYAMRGWRKRAPQASSHTIPALCTGHSARQGQHPRFPQKNSKHKKTLQENRAILCVSIIVFDVYDCFQFKLSHPCLLYMCLPVVSHSKHVLLFSSDDPRVASCRPPIMKQHATRALTGHDTTRKTQHDATRHRTTPQATA